MNQLRIPFKLHMGDGRSTFSPDEVICKYEDHQFKLPAELVPHVNQLVEEMQWKLGIELTNEPAYRLLNASLLEGHNGTKPAISLRFERTNYFDYIATNLSLDHPIFENRQTTLRQKHVKDIGSLKGSPLANILSAMALLISEPDNQILLAKRSSKVAVDRGRYQVSTGGAMRLAVDNDEQLNPSPFVTIQRELAEEVGVRLPLEAIRLLGLGIDTRTGEPELLGLAHTPLTTEELHRAFQMARHGNEEFSDITFIPFTVESVAQHLLEHTWCPGDWVCCYLALVNKFGTEAVSQHLQWQTSRGLKLSETGGEAVQSNGSPTTGKGFKDTFHLWRKRQPLKFRQLYGWGRRLVVPHYLWTHPEFERYRHWLQETAQWPLANLEAMQLERLQGLLSHAYENVPYYQQVFDACGLRPEDIVSLEDLAQLPILTKEEVRRHLPQLVARNISPDKLYYVMTGGTTGMPLGFYHQKDVSQPHEAAFMYRQWVWGGYRFGDRVALLRPYAFTQTDRNGERYFWDYCAIDNSLLLSNYLMSEKTLPLYVEKLRDFKPKFIQSFPSALFVMSRYMLDEGVHDIRPQAIFTEFEQLYPGQRALIEQAFGCPVLAGYGHSERAIDAIECPERTGYHVCMEYGVLELTDEAGRPVPCGEFGYVTGTGLDTHCMPFIRYQTDDLARFAAEPCSCGCELPLITDIMGRWQHEVVVTRDNRYIPVTTLNTHNDAFNHVQQFQYFQEKPGELVVRVVPLPSYSEADNGRIQQALLTKLHGEMEIQIVFVDKIPRTRRTKHRMLIQEIPVSLNMYSEEVAYGV